MSVQYNPVRPTSLLAHIPQIEGERASLLGTCFAYRTPATFVTAQHCVPENLDGVFVVPHGVGPPRPVARVDRHATADIAVVRVEPQEADPQWVFTGVETGDIFLVGEDLCAFGFPENGPDEEALSTPRFLRGHFQRFMPHTSHGGRFHYYAGELSFACPPGLSGAIYKPDRFPLVTAVVTANFEGFSFVDEVEERVREDLVERITSRRVITYGVALILAEVQVWLDQSVDA